MKQCFNYVSVMDLRFPVNLFAVRVCSPSAGTKDRLTVQDLYGEKMMLMRRGWSHYVDLLRDDLWKNHPQIQIVDFDFTMLMHLINVRTTTMSLWL